LVARRKKAASRRHQQLRATVRLGLIFALLVGINVYVFFFRGGTSISDVRKAAEQARIEQTVAQGPEAPRRGQDDVKASPGRLVEGKLHKGDSLAAVLRREGLTPPEAEEVVSALRDIVDFHTLREGHVYRLRYDDQGGVLSFELQTSPAVLYRVARGAGGRLVGKKTEAKTERVEKEVSGTITSSLYEAVQSCGEDPALVGVLSELFAFDLNFYLDTHAGDRFHVVVEKLYVGGEFHRYGRVLAAEYRGRVGTYRAFFYQAPGTAQGGYFDEKGRNVAKSMLKTPLKYARVSSGFSRRRMHPVLHRTKAHQGTDFAAPTGTPVWASASGRVVFVGKKGGAGNAVLIDHGGGLRTIYMHLSRFARGLRQGQHVAQKQIIGYVGQTGLATGPHLHFGVTQGGRYIDPLKLKARRQAPIAARQWGAFEATIRPRLATLERLGSHMTASLVRATKNE
jgi:murein DD-endopeptidase MepM/ murein hydrolase activator NlpD